MHKGGATQKQMPIETPREQKVKYWNSFHRGRWRSRSDIVGLSVSNAADLTPKLSETMPKHGFLTPKAISNRIKAKGLQKLRWYCEMCQKQCRDENGFKCHQTSEAHLRQMRIFAENPEAIMKQVNA